MNSEKNYLNKGVKFITISIPCLFIGPSVIHFGFINKLQPLFLVILIIGIAICATAMWMLYKGLDFILKSIFNK